jgi:hypothetical protein
MSERGVFAVDRGIFDHPVFAPEAYTEREAWLWMLSAAVWKDARVRAGRMMVDLKRGQLCFSERFLASKWQWPKTTVRRFLARLKTEAMIGALADHDHTIITICNYERYAFDGDQRGPRSGPQDGPQTDRSRTKEEEPKKVIIEDDGGGSRAKLVSDEAQETADALAAACGYPDLLNWPPGWCGAAMWVQKCLNEGWPADLMIVAAKETAQRKRDGPIEHFKYLEKPLAKAIAEHSRPLPKIEIREAENVVSYGKPKSGITQAIGDLRREIAGFDGPPRQPDGIRSEASGAAARLLSHR